MSEYRNKSCGRNAEVAAIYELFKQGRDVAVPGQRRLGKTFVLDRLVEAAARQGWTVIKVEIAGCREPSAVFRELCSAIGRQRSGGAQALGWIRQRLGQIVEQRSDHTGPWYQPLLSLDHEIWFERLIQAINDDPKRRWALLIDELPIFLKALHDSGPDGVVRARNFMNLTSRLRQGAPRVRWLVTGSIGIEPLARAGNYLGVLAKFQAFELEPLTEAQSVDFVKDLAPEGQVQARKVITEAEAQAVVDAVGWRAAFYLDAVARQLGGEATDDAKLAAAHVAAAIEKLLQPAHMTTFGTWEEHLRKHYQEPDRALAFAVLGALAASPSALTCDTLLAAIGRPSLGRQELRAVLLRLHTEGFISVGDWDSADRPCTFRSPLLRRWWQRFDPQPTV